MAKAVVEDQEVVTEEDERQATITELKRDFPPSAIKKRKGANNMELDYVTGETVLRRVMKATNDNFDVTFAFEPKFEKMEETFKDYKTNEMKKRAVLVAVVGVNMTIPGCGTRAGLGVAKVTAASEDLFKGALTDAIKNAAKNHGVALHLYGDDVEYSNNANF